MTNDKAYYLGWYEQAGVRVVDRQPLSYQEAYVSLDKTAYKDVKSRPVRRIYYKTYGFMCHEKDDFKNLASILIGLEALEKSVFLDCLDITKPPLLIHDKPEGACLELIKPATFIKLSNSINKLIPLITPDRYDIYIRSPWARRHWEEIKTLNNYVCYYSRLGFFDKEKLKNE